MVSHSRILGSLVILWMMGMIFGAHFILLVKVGGGGSTKVVSILSLLCAVVVSFVMFGRILGWLGEKDQAGTQDPDSQEII